MPLHAISYWDLEFQSVPVPFRSSAGTPQVRCVKTGMPRIPQNVLKGVFYLYENADDARAGVSPGGTGFIVRYDGLAPNLEQLYAQHFFYAVTNWHVACQS